MLFLSFLQFSSCIIQEVFQRINALHYHNMLQYPYDVRGSQPMVNNSPTGNVVVAAATLFSGNTFITLAEIAKACSLPLFSEKTFYSVQSKLLFPTTNFMYKVHQQELYTGIMNINLVIIFYRL